ncbi:hypothetical protein D9619_001349 [Psilocybe cf. subviscida]|uniref:Uncharacterized protein n=1 Tax=Psilocybe cf. subviscida TaxID=2480587 RepID=A0A8H5BFV0_9AGAR|nr:hypothetical protein D9619_001349 [Psilocybe cf. subviscida]
MGDLANGLAWLCGTCCGLRKADITADGSRFSSSGKAHPAEREIDKEFMARNYRKDAAGYLHSQPTPTNSMMPRQNSDDSKKSKRSAKAQREQPKEDAVQVVPAPQEDDDDVPIITVDQASTLRHSRRHSSSVDEQASLKSKG